MSLAPGKGDKPLAIWFIRGPFNSKATWGTSVLKWTGHMHSEGSKGRLDSSFAVKWFGLKYLCIKKYFAIYISTKVESLEY